MNTAARIAEHTLLRSLDSIHLGAAQRAGLTSTALTLDVRQASAARQVGLAVIGA